MKEILNLLDQIVDNNTFNCESDYIFNNHKVPRVTKIIQTCIHNDGLMYWSNSLGFKHQSYRKTLDTAANIGTQCHSCIDHFIDDNKYKAPIDTVIEARFAYDSFLKWFNDIQLYANIEILYHEKSLVSKYFGGTLDGLYRINNEIFIIDYKTSNHITYNYCLQIAAYLLMLEWLENISADGCIILQLSKSSIAYNEFSLNFNNRIDREYIEECKRAFLSMVLYYYHLNLVSSGFDRLNWR